MRQSTARLADSSIRLAELSFPHSRVHIHRTRLPFIHLDNLLHFAKMDRDGRVDGFVAVYLPDEVTVLLLGRGELVNAVSLTPAGRQVVPIAPALKHVRAETERGELVFCDATVQQLAWMFASCAEPAAARFVDARHPETLLPALKHEGFTGVLEVISCGRVNYLRFENGDYRHGVFHSKPDGMPVPDHVVELFRSGGSANASAAVFRHADTIPQQASPKLIETYRELFWALVHEADREASGEAKKHAMRYRDLLHKVHPSLDAVSRTPDGEPPDIVVTPQELTLALADWAMHFLEQVEVVAPGAASDVLRNATREHRFVLQKAGFYERVPWTVRW
jgi:hypothetical protein